MTYEDYANRASDAIEGFDGELLSAADTLEESAVGFRRVSRMCESVFSFIEDDMKFTDSAEERVDCAEKLKQQAQEIWEEFDEAQTNASFVLNELRAKIEQATSDMEDAADDALAEAEG